jgi:hypothetical protein
MDSRLRWSDKIWTFYEFIKDGEKQVKEYGKKLEQQYGNLRLQKFVVVALGFERVCFRKI